MSIEVTFIIPHKGREALLIDTLRSITEQQSDISTIEIMLVSQNAAVSSEVSQFQNKIRLHIHQCSDELTISDLRNYGVSHSSAKWLAFLDADVAIAPNWLTIMRKKIAEPNVSLVAAMQVCEDDATPLEKIRTALSNTDVDKTVTFLPGRNLFLARETFDAVGGFPSHLLTCEDYYFTERVSQLGHLVYTSQSTYYHLGEDKDYTEMYKKEIWRGQSNLASIKGRKIPLREYPSFAVPFLVCVGCLAAVIALILQSPIIAALAGVLLMPFFAYTCRLYLLVKNQVSMWHVVKFYLYYFPARAYGTAVGALKQLTTDSHNQ